MWRVCLQSRLSSLSCTHLRGGKRSVLRYNYRWGRGIAFLVHDLGAEEILRSFVRVVVDSREYERGFHSVYVGRKAFV
jgi:hypothetical protein